MHRQDPHRGVPVKRAYEPAKSSDGYRVLVERLWPRGLRKEDAHFDAWMKDVAPSSQLRTWFGHDPALWREFRARYRRELRAEKARAALDALARRAILRRVTLVYSSRDEEHNSALVLREEVERRAAALRKQRDRKTIAHGRTS